MSVDRERESTTYLRVPPKESIRTPHTAQDTKDFNTASENRARKGERDQVSYGNSRIAPIAEDIAVDVVGHQLHARLCQFLAHTPQLPCVDISTKYFLLRLFRAIVGAVVGKDIGGDVMHCEVIQGWLSCGYGTRDECRLPLSDDLSIHFHW